MLKNHFAKVLFKLKARMVGIGGVITANLKALARLIAGENKRQGLLTS